MQQFSRRSAWAVPLLVIIMIGAAALACSVEFSTAHFEDAATYTDPRREDRTRVFTPDETVHVIVTLKDVEGTIPVKAVWKQVIVETEGDRETEREVELFTQEQTSGNGTMIFEHAPPDAWEKAAYKVELYLDGDRRETVEFKVK